MARKKNQKDKNKKNEEEINFIFTYLISVYSTYELFLLRSSLVSTSTTQLYVYTHDLLAAGWDGMWALWEEGAEDFRMSWGGRVY